MSLNQSAIMSTIAALALSSTIAAPSALFADAPEFAPGVKASGEALDFSLNKDEESAEQPLLLAFPEENAANENAPQTASAEESNNAQASENVPSEQAAEVLPENVAKAYPGESVVPESDPPLEFSEEEMRRLSNEPLFKEFSSAVGDVAPLPEDVDLGAVVAPGTEYFITGDNMEFAPEVQNLPASALPTQDLSKALDEVLAIADVDLTAIEISDADRATLTRLDVEIRRLADLWIETELNLTTFGRRERDWRFADLSRFSTSDPAPIDDPANDWSLAPDASFFFKVVGMNDSQEYFTKAGDFEALDASGTIGLARPEQSYFLAIEPSVAIPSGRAERTRILKNGRIQGVKINDKTVTDFNLGRVQLFMFDNPSRLESVDGVFFVPTPFSGEPKLLDLPNSSKIGLTQRKLLPSNGRPDEIFARLVILCKSKKRLIEVLTQPK